MIRVLFTLWLFALAGAAWGDAGLSKPVFLVARPDLLDPNFHDSVVLLDWRKLPVDARALFDVKPEQLWGELDRRASATLARYGAARAAR